MMKNSEQRSESAAIEIKKGPWTAAEDAILTEYVRKNGEGNWNNVHKNSGLLRCGKSCRLRWANHLRPNLKKGSFSPHEENIIIELHAKLGNKWARMASQLPGRTDNEIKNFWNTRMKRRQRAGLPLYPNDKIQHLFNQTLHFNYPQTMTTSYNHNHNNQIPSNQVINFTHPIISNNNPQLNYSKFVPLNIAINNSPMINSAMVSPYGNFDQQNSASSASDESCRFDDVVSGEMGRFDWVRNSGLLGDLVVEGRALSQNKRAKKITVAGEYSDEVDGGGGEAESTENLTENNFSSGDQSSIGIEQNEDPLDVSSMDEDLMSLLNNFPSSNIPVTADWCSREGESDVVLSSREIPAVVTRGIDAKLDNNNVLQNGSIEVKSSDDQGSLSSCAYWNNMPGIC